MLREHRCECLLLDQKVFLRGVITQGSLPALFERQRDPVYDVLEESEAGQEALPPQQN